MNRFALSLFRVLFALPLLSSHKTSAQKIYQVLSVEHHTGSRFPTSKVSGDLIHNLFHKDSAHLAQTPLSKSGGLTPASIFGYIKPFHQNMPKDFYDGTVFNPNDNGSTYPDASDSVWQEFSFYSLDTNTKAVKIITQLLIVFEGSDDLSVAMNPRVRRIEVRNGDQMIDRTAAIKKFMRTTVPDFDGPPPAVEHLKHESR